MEHWWRNGRAGEDTAPPSLYATRTIDRLVAIEPVPIRAHLLTYVYVSEGSGTELDWAVCDPFGRGASITLRRWLLERGQDDEHLEQYVDELLEREGSKSLAELRATERSLELGARQVLVRQLGLGLEDHPRIHEHLRNALVELEAARALGGSARTRRCSNGLLSCRKSLEALFSTLAERWPLDAVELPIDPDLRQNAIEQAGVACRLDPIPAPLLHIQPKQLRSVTRYEDNWRARPLLLATLLCARHDTSHPLRHAAQRDARLLERIDGVLETSSKSVHDGRSSPSLAMLERCTNTTISVVGLLLDLNDSWARPADG